MALAALIISIFAVLFAGAAAWVALTVLRHDQAQTGTRQPIIARKGYRDIPFNEYDPDPKPAGWELDQMRWVPIRLINRSGYDITLEGPTYAGLGWRWPVRREVQVEKSKERPPINKTAWFFVRMRKRKWWSWPKRRFLTVHWAADEGPVKFKGWVNLRRGLTPPPPPADS